MLAGTVAALPSRVERQPSGPDPAYAIGNGKPWLPKTRISLVLGFLVTATMLVGLENASAQGNELPMVSVNRVEETVTEGSGPIGFTLRLEEAHTADLDVTVEPSQTGSWFPPVPFDNFVVTIPQGQLTQGFTVPLLNDFQMEPDGSVTMRVAAGGTAYGIGTPGMATVTVVDDEVPMTVLIDAATLRVSEGSGSAQLPFTYRIAGGKPPGTYELDGTIFEGIPVAFSSRGDTAQSPSDYRGVTVVLRFQAGLFSQQPSGDYELTSSFRVKIHDDTLDEGASESFRVIVEKSPGVVSDSLVLPSQDPRIVIEDDDTADLRLTVDPDTVKEGETATVSARIDGDVVFGQTETVTLAFTGTATENSDYDADGASLTISPGSRGPSNNVVITALEDDTVEACETVRVTPSRNGETVPGEIVLTIADKSPPELRAAVVNKSMLTLTYNEVLNTDSEPPKSAYAVTVSGSPRTVSDVEVTGSAVTVTLASPVYHGQPVALTYTVPAANPVQDSDGSQAGALATITVTNSTPAVTVSYDQSSFTATEGGADAVVTLRLSEASGRSLTIEITAAGRGGADANDYSGVPSGVTFQADETAGSFRVTAADDEVDDDGETVELGFGTLPDGTIAGSVMSAVVRLADNDTAAVPPGAPTDLRARPSSRAVLLSWNAPSDDGGSPVKWHEYRWKEEPGAYGRWRSVGSSGTSIVADDLRNDQLYAFPVRAVNAAGPGEPSNEARATPRIGQGICGRTPQVQDAILAKLGGRFACEDVSATDLAGIRGTLDLGEPPIHKLQTGDFAGLTGVTALYLDNNLLRSLPSGVLRDVVRLRDLGLGWNWLPLREFPFDDLEALPDLRKATFLGNPGNIPGMLVSPSHLSIRPGGSGRYSIRLRTEPDPEGATVTIDPDGTLSSSADSLTFTRENWFRSQHVTVSAAPGAAGGRARVRHRTTGFEDWGDGILSGPTLDVTISGSQAPSGGSQTEPSSVAPEWGPEPCGSAQLERRPRDPCRCVAGTNAGYMDGALGVPARRTGAGVPQSRGPWGRTRVCASVLPGTRRGRRADLLRHRVGGFSLGAERDRPLRTGAGADGSVPGSATWIAS